MKSLSFEEFQATRKRVLDLEPWMPELAGETGFIYEDQIYIHDQGTREGPQYMYSTQVGRETYVSDRLDRVECWLWEEITGFTCPFNKWGLSLDDMPQGEYPEEQYTYITALEDLVPEQVEEIVNNRIGVENGFGDAIWLNFAAIDKLWVNKSYVMFDDEGVTLYKVDGRFDLLVMKAKITIGEEKLITLGRQYLMKGPIGMKIEGSAVMVCKNRTYSGWSDES